jgi:hypothetical protein
LLPKKRLRSDLIDSQVISEIVEDDEDKEKEFEDEELQEEPIVIKHSK